MFTMNRQATRPGTGALPIVLTCAFVILLEGYDQGVYGSALPALVHDPSWHLSNSKGVFVGSAAFAGMLFGALAAGTLATRFGRRSVVLSLISVMAVFGTACAFTSTATMLATFRFLTGVGLGGLLPLTSTITLAVAPARRRSMIYAAMFAAIPIGGLLAAVVAVRVIPAHGPMVLFALPLPLLLIAAVMSWLFLPTTPAGAEESGLVPRTASYAEFRGARLRPTVFFVAATLVGLLLWYGLNTWLPGIMRAAGYELGPSLGFQAVLNAGAAVGSVVVALFADRLGGPRVAVAIYAGAALVMLATISAPPQVVLYLLILLAGTSAQGGLVVLNSVVDRSYPPHLRGQALGLTLSIGRLGAIAAPSLVGQIVGHSSAGSFTLFAGCAVAAAIFIALATRGLVTAPAETTVPAEAAGAEFRSATGEPE